MSEKTRVTRRTLIGGATAAAVGAAAVTPSAGASQRHGGGGWGDSTPPRGNEYVLRDGFVLSMDPSIGDLPRGDVHVRNGQIVAVGERLRAHGAASIDARDKIVMPGLVDTHWHLWNAAMRPFIVNGVADRGYFNVTNVLGPFFTPTDTYRATRFGLLEGVASGITTVHDWSHNVRGPDYADASLRGLLDAGVRGRFSYGWAQRGPLDVPMDVAGIRRTMDRWFSRASTTRGLLHLGIASRNVVPGQSPRGSITIELARQDWTSARELGLPITLHASPRGLVTMLEEARLLGPDLLLVHPTLTTEAENALVVERGTGWSMSSVEEASRGPEEQIRYAELVAAGAKLGISIDASATGGANLFVAMRLLHTMMTNRLGAVPGITYRRVLELATVEGAHTLGLGDVVGSLTPGKRADVITINRLDPNIAPPGDPATQIVGLAQPRNVDTVMVDGKILLWRGSHVGVDVERVVRDAGQSATEISRRAGWPA